MSITEIKIHNYRIYTYKKNYHTQKKNPIPIHVHVFINCLLKYIPISSCRDPS